MRIATEIAVKIKEIINDNRDFEHINFYQTNGEISMTINKNNKKYHHILKKYESESKAIKIIKKLKIYYSM